MNRILQFIGLNMSRDGKKEVKDDSKDSAFNSWEESRASYGVGACCYEFFHSLQH